MKLKTVHMGSTNLNYVPVLGSTSGDTLDANIKPGLTSNGFGYPGAFVYQYENQFWGAVGYHVYEFVLGAEYVAPFDPTRYNDGITNWQVNQEGRITRRPPIMGYPPGIGKGGGRGGKFGGKTGRKTNPDRVYVWKERIEQLKEQLKNATTKTDKKEIQRQIKHAQEKLKASEPHGRKGQGY